MTYYDELGVASNASPEEIRKAFHGVSRMLHPDLQPEGALRHLAEAQMKRLNEVVETLCHEDRRDAYDSALQTVPPAALPPAVESLQLKTPLPALVAGLVFGCLLMYFVSVITRPEFEAAERAVDEAPVMITSPGAATPGTATPGTATPGTATPGSSSTSVKSQATVPPRRDVLSSFGQDRSSAPEASASQVAAPPPLPAIESIIAIPVASPLPAIDSAPQLAPPLRPLSGIWLHAIDPKDKPARWAYAADYVELRLQETNGEIVGAYRSRYRVPNRVFQPEVAFRFRGPARGDEFDWEGIGGTRGKIHIQLHGDNIMEASWKVADSGNVNGLASGSATLVRRLD